MNIIRNIDGTFGKGNNSGVRFTRETSLGNKHAKGNPPNKTSFDGTQVLEKHPCWKGGIHHMKNGVYIMLAPKKRIRRARYVWEQAHGEIPKGHIVLHIDGDRNNDDINNLTLISRKELLKINQYK